MVKLFKQIPNHESFYILSDMNKADWQALIILYLSFLAHFVERKTSTLLLDCVYCPTNLFYALMAISPSFTVNCNRFIGSKLNLLKKLQKS